MRYNEIKITEALKPSEFRKLVKGWDKERYREIFLNPNYKHDRNGYRVFIPLGKSSGPSDQKSQTQQEVEKFLSANGYQLVDYIKGIVQNVEKKQQIKIGKVLSKLEREDLLNKFNVDKSREGTKSNYIVVISRHPYDIAGMSTDRGWTSCMNLHNGENRHYVPIDIKQGSVVAYVTSDSDVNLNNPSGRVLIKPFIDLLGKHVVHFGIEDNVYGTNIPGFIDVVKKWVNEVNQNNALDDVVALVSEPTLYNDSSLSGRFLLKGKKLSPDIKAKIVKVEENPQSILDMENPPEIVQLVAISKDPFVFRELISKEDYMPSETVQRYAVITVPQNIFFILKKGIKPSELVQLAAVNGSWNMIFQLFNHNIDVPDSVAKKALEKNPRLMPDLIQKGYKIDNDMLEKGLRNNGEMLDWYFRKQLPVNIDTIVTAIENGYSKAGTLYAFFKEKGVKFPPSITSRVAPSYRAANFIKNVVIINNDKETANKIPLNDKDLLTAIVTELTRKDDDNEAFLFNKVYDEYPHMLSEKSWITVLKNLPAEFYDDFVDKGLISPNTKIANRKK